MLKQLIKISILILKGLSVLGQTNSINNCIPTIDTFDKQTVLISVEIMPEFNFEGQSESLYIFKNLQYPIEQNDLQGKVIVTFIIDTFGTVRNSCICNPYHASKVTPLEREVLRVFNSMPKWKSAVNGGIKVPIRLKMPIFICQR